MNKINYKEIEEVIGYRFKNGDLLYQAFVDSELDIDCDNKSLAFVGESILTSIVTSYLASIYSDDENVFSFTKPIEEINEIKLSILSKKYLSTRVGILNVKKYYSDGLKLYSDRKIKDISITILKAIIGAIAIDSNYNYKNLNKSVIRLVDPTNYILNYQGIDYEKCLLDYTSMYNEIDPEYELDTNTDGRYLCDCYLVNPDIPGVFTPKIYFRGFGFTEDEARADSARAAYDYLVRDGYLEPTILTRDCKRIAEIIKSAPYTKAVDTVGKLVGEKLLSKPIITTEYINKRYYARVVVDEYKDEFLADSSKLERAKRRALNALLERMLSDIEKNN